MRNIAEFQIIGRVGVVKKVGSTTHVTIASNYSYKDEGGEWRDDPHTGMRSSSSRPPPHGTFEKYIGKGDLVHARGRVRQNTYERDDGERVFTVDLICNDFSRLAQAADNRDGEHRDADARDNSFGRRQRSASPSRMTPFPTDRLAGGEAPRLPSSLFRSFVNRESFSDSTTSLRARRRTTQVLPRASRTAPRSRRSSRSRSRATRP